MTLPQISGTLAGRSAPTAASHPVAPRPGTSPELKKAASEFEGMLISTLWKGLLDDPMGGLDSDADPASGSIQSLGMQAMSTAISASGGLGLAKMVERQLAPRPQSGNVGIAPLAGSPRPPLSLQAATPTSLKSHPISADNRGESSPQAPPAAILAPGSAAQPLPLSARVPAMSLEENSGDGA